MEFTTNGIDRNEIVQKIDKIDFYIQKAEKRLAKNEKDLDRIYAKEIGDKEEVENALKVMNKARSSQIR